MANWIQAEAGQQVINAAATTQIGRLDSIFPQDRLVGIFITDQPGNLTVEYSTNGTNWDYIETTAVVANTGVKVSSEVVAPFCRVRFNNTGGGATTFVRAQFKASSAGPR